MHLLHSTRRLTAAFVLLLGAASCAALVSPASAQVLNARRLAMGGVQLSDLGSGGNVAYEAVPHARDGRINIPIPLGLLQLASDPPEFDTKDSTFNIFEIANLILHPPLALQLGRPSAPESDINVRVARDSLRIDLGDLQRVVPSKDWALTSLLRAGYTQRFGPVFAGVHLQGQMNNSVGLDENLRGALGHAVPFRPNTRYGIEDSAQAQVAASVEFGAAIPVLYRAAAGTPEAEAAQRGDPRTNHATALYVGGRAKYLKGLAYASGSGDAFVETQDPLFGSNNSLNLQSDALARTTPDFGKGNGAGADVGAVLFANNFEVGLGLNDVGSKITWVTDLDRYHYDAGVDSFIHTAVARGEKVSITYPMTTTLSGAWRRQLLTVGITAQHAVGDWTYHLGGEIQATPLLAVRAGWHRDAAGLAQYSGGAGVRLGPVGLDAGASTSSLTITRERLVDLALSLVIY